MEIRPFERRDLPGVLALCAGEGWTSWAADRDRSLRALTAPGVTVLVAVDGEQVIGFAHVLTDGQWHAFLANLVVSGAHRGRGIARRLVLGAAAHTGIESVDLLSEADATGFYETFAHRRRAGFRIYPLRESSDPD